MPEYGISFDDEERDPRWTETHGRFCHMTIAGKGYYLWKIPQVARGDPSAIVARALEAGLTHVLIKIADGPSWVYNYDYATKTDLVPPVRDALQSAGIKVWGWHYIWGDDPVGEARLAVNRVRSLNLDGYVIDAESQFKDPDKKSAAERFMRDLKSGLTGIPIGFSSYRYPRLHPEVPYDIFLQGCDYALPQVYFELAHNPEEQLAMSVEQYYALKNARPIVPTGPTYHHNGWRPSADEVERFMHKAKAMGLEGVNFWSMDFATQDSMADLWRTVAGFQWSKDPPPADMPERLVELLNQRDAGQVAALYTDRAAHVTGARTIVGRELIEAWYKALFKKLLPKARFEMTSKSISGRSRHVTWKASSDNGSVSDGNDTLGLQDGLIQYHYTYFTITHPA